MSALSKGQVEHARQIVDILFKQRRFFLPDGASIKKPLSHLSPIDFDYVYELNAKLNQVYKTATQIATGQILNDELNMGIARPKLEENQSIVKCSRYSGGLSIVGIRPLTDLLVEIPNEPVIMTANIFSQQIPEEERGDMTANAIEKAKLRFHNYAKNVCLEFNKLKSQTDWQSLMVVTLETKFEPSSLNDDFMRGKCNGLITYPHLLSYLLYKDALAGTKPNTFHTIFGTSRSGHVRICQSSDELELDTSATCGYDCIVTFATIL